MFDIMKKTLNRLLNQQQEVEAESNEYSNEELISAATSCMLEGLSDVFYEAKIVCVQENIDGERVVSTSYLVKSQESSQSERFEPADYLFPVQCIEKILKDQQWHEATILFTPDQAKFFWQ